MRPISFPNDHSKADYLLQFFSVCACLAFVNHYLFLVSPSFWCFERAVLRDLGISLGFSFTYTSNAYIQMEN